MKRALLTDFIREVKRSWSRYISIMAIVCLGVGFFAGLNASSPDMILTADTYYTDTNLMDIRIVSTYGLTDEDINALKVYPGIDTIEPTYTVDAILAAQDETYVIRAHSLPSVINQVTLIEGRLPEKPNECLIENGPFLPAQLTIGNTISLYLKDDDIFDSLVTDTFTIVGVIESPYYLTFEKGSSSVGTGGVSSYIMLPESSFALEVYTDVFATLTLTKDLSFNTPFYKNAVTSFVDGMDDFKQKREEERFDELVVEAQSEFDKEKNKALNKLSDAKKTLDDAKYTLDKAQKDLNANKKKALDGFEQAKQTLDGLNYQLSLIDQNQIQLLISTVEGLQAQILSVNNDLTTLNNNLASMKQLLATLDPSSMEYTQLSSEISQLETQIFAKNQELSGLQNALNPLLPQVNDYYQLLAGIKTCEDVLKTKPTVLKQLAAGQKEIDQGYRSYFDGLGKYNSSYEKAMKELDDAQKEIDDLAMTEWFIFTRTDNIGYSEFAENANRISAISKIFPAFFLSIAALVCLASMTRMVDENRTQIGVYKALGYNNTSIALKYLLYSGSATLIGCIIGLSLGFIVFPTIIFNAYRIMYRMPDVMAPFRIDIALQSILLAELATMGASAISCYKELSATPASLIRPKAPRNGKRVLIERIGFLWKRFSFTQKVTVRNLFRYKKRMLMTVIGIAGCTSLIVGAFGVRDSINAIGHKQFSEIAKQDVAVIFNKDFDIEGYKERSKNYPIDNQLFVSFHLAKIEREENTPLEISLIVPEDSKKFEDFVCLKTLKTQTPLPLTENGIMVSEKLASLVGVSVGQEISFTIDDKTYTATIDGIFENYLGHYFYMSKEYYQTLTNTEIELTQVFILSDADANVLGTHLIDDESVLALISFEDISKEFDDVISSLNIVVAVLITCAAFLALIVLFNLVNINVTERMRELATIKVLGFRDNEVTTYLYRENIILTLIGIVTGFGVGIILHQIVIQTLEIDTLLFGRTIAFLSYVYAAGLTIVFSILINIYTHFNLKRIDMIESLKSVE